MAITEPQFTPDYITLRSHLLSWYKVKGREFAWRNTSNAFFILLSELMLRRTRARQVEKVYVSFIQKYPTPQTLAEAQPEDVRKDLYSLGLAWRVPAFQQLAKTLLSKFAGKVPDNYADLINLPGVGDYVASAVSAFAFNQPVAVVDVNTVRVAGRVHGIDFHAESRRNKVMRTLIYNMLDTTLSRDFNYAMLDLSATLCTARLPKCPTCPIRPYCHYGLTGNASKL